MKIKKIGKRRNLLVSVIFLLIGIISPREGKDEANSILDITGDNVPYTIICSQKD